MPNSRAMKLNQSLGVGLGHQELFFFFFKKAPQMILAYRQGENHFPEACRIVGIVREQLVLYIRLPGWESLR